MTSWFLSTVNPWLTLLSLALTTAGVLGLHHTWAKPARNWKWLGFSWGILWLALWPWMSAVGWDRGIAMLCLSVGLIALLVILIRTPWRQWESEGRKKSPRSQPTTTGKNVWIPLFRVFCRILVVGVLSFCAALGIALACFALLDTSTANRTVYAALLILLLWPCLMVWSQAKNSLLKPALYFVGIGLCGWLFTPAIF